MIIIKIKSRLFFVMFFTAVIGLCGFLSNSRLFADLLSGLRDLNYVEGETITIDRWSGEGQTEEGLSRMVDDVIESKPDIIVVGGRRLTPAFMAATKTIPD